MKSIHHTTTIAPLTAGQINALKTHMEGIQDILQFDTGLTKPERRRMMRLSRENLLFVEDAVDAITHLPELCPSFLNAQEVIDLVELFHQLRFFEQTMKGITDALKDRRLQTGNECFHNGRMIYQVTKLAANNGYPKARPIYNQMKRRFHISHLSYQPDLDEGNQNLTVVEDGISEKGEAGSDSEVA